MFTETLDTFQKKWWWTFLWVLLSSITLHGVIALASIATLHGHKFARWYFVCVALMAVVMPLTGGAITSAVVAGVFQSLGWEMTPLVGLLCGVSQTGIVVCSSLTRFLSTL